MQTRDEQAQQLHHRADLRHRDPEGTARRLPRRDGAGDPAYHRRDQTAHPAGGRRYSTSVIVEVGGTVGDIESLPFLEAIREFRWDLGRENVLYVHLTLVPFIPAAGELKTKPTQHSVKELTGLGIQPDILLCRCDRPLEKKFKAKIAHFCNVEENCVISAPRRRHDLRSSAAAFTRKVSTSASSRSSISGPAQPNLAQVAATRQDRAEPQGHGQRRGGRQIRQPGRFVQEPARSDRARRDRQRGAGQDRLRRFRGAGKGRRRRSGSRTPTRLSSRAASASAAPRARFSAVRYAREKRRADPRHLPRPAHDGDRGARATCSGSSGPTRREIAADSPDPVIHIMESQKDVAKKGGTMRLGAYPCVLRSGSLASSLYRRSQDLRAPSPSLRSQQRLSRGAREERASSPPALRPTISWSKSWS